MAKVQSWRREAHEENISVFGKPEIMVLNVHPFSISFHLKRSENFTMAHGSSMLPEWKHVDGKFSVSFTERQSPIVVLHYASNFLITFRILLQGNPSDFPWFINIHVGIWNIEQVVSLGFGSFIQSLFHLHLLLFMRHQVFFLRQGLIEGEGD